MSARPRTLGELKPAATAARRSSRRLRRNLRRRLETGEPLFPDIIGYDRTVIPAVANAAAGRPRLHPARTARPGQDSPACVRWPSCSTSGSRSSPDASSTTIRWRPSRPPVAAHRGGGRRRSDRLAHRELRYNEKLATPDVSIADLLGDIDPIKAATRKLTFADPEVIHFGIVPRTNRGIFAINELPDLAPRIQVGLLNLLEERDLQIRGFPIRIPLDLLMVFSANPEDYTNRGTIITPLKDRLSSQILTHYPADVAQGTRITRQEADVDRGEDVFELSPLAWELVEQIAFSARESELVDQTSGISARLPISAMELLASNLERRALRHPGDRVTPRVCDLQMLLPAITGKVEMVYEGEQKGAEVVARQLVGQAVREVFGTPAARRSVPSWAAGARTTTDPMRASSPGSPTATPSTSPTSRATPSTRPP